MFFFACRCNRDPAWSDMVCISSEALAPLILFAVSLPGPLGGDGDGDGFLESPRVPTHRRWTLRMATRNDPEMARQRRSLSHDLSRRKLVDNYRDECWAT